MRFRIVVGAGLLAFSASSCSLGDPVVAGSVNVFVEVSDPQLTVGEESVTITVTARNLGSDAISLTGPSDCLLFVEVFETQGSKVWRSNASCVGATVTEEISAGQDKSLSFTWSGTNTAGAGLAPGNYLLRGGALTTDGATVSLPVTIALD